MAEATPAGENNGPTQGQEQAQVQGNGQANGQGKGQSNTHGHTHGGRRKSYLIRGLASREKAMQMLSDSAVNKSNKGPLMQRVHPRVIEAQTSFIVHIQQFGISLVPTLSLLCSGKAILLLLMIVCWYGDADFGWRPVRTASLMLLVNGFAKAWAQGPRPYWVDAKVAVLDPTVEVSFGFPSGHATAAVSVYGVITAHLIYDSQTPWWPLLLLTWILLVLGVSFSRVYTGAHFVHDTVVGCFLGALVLALEFFVDGTPGLVPYKQGNLGEAAFLLLSAAVSGVFVYANIKDSDGNVEFHLVAEGLTGTGFCNGLAIAHIIAFIRPYAATNQSALSCPNGKSMGLLVHFCAVLSGLLGLQVLSTVSKKIPTVNNNGHTRSPKLWVADSFCYSAMLVWLMIVVPRQFYVFCNK